MDPRANTPRRFGGRLGSSARARLRRGVAALALLAVAMCASAGAGPSDTPSPSLWVVDGTVLATAHSGSTLYIGGSFGYVGPNSGSFVSLDGSTGQATANWPYVNGQVLATAPDGSGG